MKILIAGGKGRFGQEIVKVAGDGAIALSHEELDVTKPETIKLALEKYSPEIVLNCAAVLSVAAEADHRRAYDVNSKGAGLLAAMCEAHNVPSVFVSTDYVFGGNRGNYSIDATPDPINEYGKSKRSGELDVLAASNSFVLRAPFRYRPWPYDNAFVDHWTSARWVNEVVPDILEYCEDPCTSGLKRIKHIPGPRTNLYKMVLEIEPGVVPSSRLDCKQLLIPRDVSLAW